MLEELRKKLLLAALPTPQTKWFDLTVPTDLGGDRPEVKAYLEDARKEITARVWHDWMDELDTAIAEKKS